MSPPLLARDAAPEVSVVMPAHNEAGFLDQTLKVLVSALRDRTLTFELLVVENGSTDSTLADARTFAAGDPTVSVLTRPVADYGEAMRAGILAAVGTRGRGVRCRLLRPGLRRRRPPLLTAVDGPAIVVGSKRAPGTHDTRPWPRPRDHRRLRDGAAVGLRAPGVRHPRDEGDAQDRRSNRSWRVVATAPTSSTPSSSCGPTVPVCASPRCR